MKQGKKIFHVESLFGSSDNQILTSQVFKCHDVIECPSMKHKKTFYWIVKAVSNEIWLAYMILQKKKFYQKFLR